MKHIVFGGAFVTLVACGGGGGSAPPSQTAARTEPTSSAQPAPSASASAETSAPDVANTTSSDADDAAAAPCDDDLNIAGARNKCQSRCAHDEARACNDLAEYLHEKGEGEKAAPFYGKACFGGYGAACLEYGNSAAAGLAGDISPTKYQKMLAAYVKGCDLGDANSCSEVGETLAKGQDVPKDPAKAMAAYGKACLLSVVLGCKEIKQGVASGNHDAVAALAGIRRKCVTGTRGACESLTAAGGKR